MVTTNTTREDSLDELLSSPRAGTRAVGLVIILAPILAFFYCLVIRAFLR